MTQPLLDRLRAVQVREPQTAGSLQVFGLHWGNGTALSYRTLDEALAADLLEVTEISEGGSVPILKVINKGDDLIFLMAGEQLVGAKQNRILNTSILVPARSELVIPVSCVEAGRWGYRSRKFGSSGTMSHGKLRKMLTEQVHDSYADLGLAASKQGEVWQEVSRKLTSLGSVSPSAALEQSYEDHNARLRDFLGQLSISPECCGVAFVVAGRMVGVDLFDRSATLAQLWPKVARAYAIDVMEEKAAPVAPLPVEAVQRWLQTASEAQTQSYKSPGLGYDVRLKNDRVIGASLMVDDQPVHAELFAVEEKGQ
jgi:hypothetical protein